MFAGERRVAVWDAREPGWFGLGERAEARRQWMKDRDLPARYIYRAEFYDGDAGPRVKIYSYAAGENGQRHWSPEHVPGPHDHRVCCIVEDLPRWVPLNELPPQDLFTITGQRVGV